MLPNPHDLARLLLMSALDSFRVLGVMAFLFLAFAVGLYVLSFIGRLLSIAFRSVFPAKPENIIHHDNRI